MRQKEVGSRCLRSAELNLDYFFELPVTFFLFGLSLSMSLQMGRALLFPSSGVGFDRPRSARDSPFFRTPSFRSTDKFERNTAKFYFVSSKKSRSKEVRG